MRTGLAVQDLDVSRGGREILHGVSLVAPAGEVTALLGPNGAGKSTLVLALSGLLPADAGEVHINGVPIAGSAPDTIRRHGLAVVAEGHRVLTKLSVLDNLRVAAVVADDIGIAWDVFPELKQLASQRAGSLSGGQQQMLALAQALVAHPSVVVADEISLGLAPIVVRRLMDVVSQLREGGTGVLLIEQFTKAALAVSQNAYVMSRGHMTFGGAAADLTARPDVLDAAYLGLRTDDLTPS